MTSAAAGRLEQVVVGLRGPPADDEHGCVVDLERVRPPSSRRVAVQLAPRDPEAAVEPLAVDLDRSAEVGPGERVVAAHHVGQRHRRQPVRSRASASRRACHASYCQKPEPPRDAHQHEGQGRRAEVGQQAGSAGGGHGLDSPSRPVSDAGSARRARRAAG